VDPTRRSIFASGADRRFAGNANHALLARRKIAIATQLGSRAMRADAAESITCGWLSLVVVVGLVADLMLGAWWVDAVTSLVIVGFVVKEAREAWSCEDCCDYDERVPRCMRGRAARSYHPRERRTRWTTPIRYRLAQAKKSRPVKLRQPGDRLTR